MRKLTRENFLTQPWKNGGGTTTELIRLGTEDFDLRLSMAKVETDGPFSTFPGVDRHLLILQGIGLNLRRGNEEIVLTKSSLPLEFSGDENVTSTLLDGPVLDFNVMVKRSWGKAEVSWMDGGHLDSGTEFSYAFNPLEMVLFELAFLESIDLGAGPWLIIKIKRAVETALGDYFLRE